GHVIPARRPSYVCAGGAGVRSIRGQNRFIETEGRGAGEVTDWILRIPVNAISTSFVFIGIAYCLYIAMFRLPSLRNKYGTMSLYWWLTAILFAFSFAGWLLALAIWLIQRQLSN